VWGRSQARARAAALVKEIEAEAAVLLDRLTTYVSAYNIAMEEDEEPAVTKSIVKKIGDVSLGVPNHRGYAR
jgi:adenosyl cobinamide kinase/adenosyl cobinamide phosphate guanylyltransferase